MNLPTLYDYWRSSSAYRVRIALNLKNLDYRSVSVDLLAGEQKGTAHLVRNPQGLVPAIEIDGRPMAQSLAIIEYLEEVHPDPPLLPSTPSERQRVRALAHAIAMEIHPVCNLGVARYGASLIGGEDGMKRWMQHFMAPGLAAFERLLDDPRTGRYCHGDTVTIADLCLVPQIYNAQRWEVPLDGLPRLRAITAALEALPPFQAAHPNQVGPPTT